MQGKAKMATCLFLGVFAAGLLAQPEFARSKTMPVGKKFTAARATSAAVKPVPEPETYALFIVGLALMAAIRSRRDPAIA